MINDTMIIISRAAELQLSFTNKFMVYDNDQFIVSQNLLSDGINYFIRTFLNLPIA